MRAGGGGGGGLLTRGLGGNRRRLEGNGLQLYGTRRRLGQRRLEGNRRRLQGCLRRLEGINGNLTVTGAQGGGGGGGAAHLQSVAPREMAQNSSNQTGVGFCTPMRRKCSWLCRAPYGHPRDANVSLVLFSRPCQPRFTSFLSWAISLGI